MAQQKKNQLHRIDIQVALLTTCLVVLSSVCIFYTTYRVAYDDMLVSLAERVEAIYSIIDKGLSYESFVNINNRNDINDATYVRTKEDFSNIKCATGVQYLYTAKRGNDGQLIYVIDGLDQSASDFRYPGDLIEAEIVPDLERALAGERVMPVDIKHTAWGDIFIAYLPVHNNENEVVGAVGIEFFAEHQYKTYQLLRSGLPVTLLLLGAISTGLMLIVFRRLLVAHDRELTAIDPMTGLPNRNSYWRDVQTLHKGAGMGIIAVSLEGLRRVNDQHGQQAGDDYITAMATALGEAESGRERLYRICDGEFAVLVVDADEGALAGFAQTLETTFRANSSGLSFAHSYHVGWAICTGTTDAAYAAAYRDAYAAAHQGGE